MYQDFWIMNIFVYNKHFFQIFVLWFSNMFFSNFSRNCPHFCFYFLLLLENNSDALNVCKFSVFYVFKNENSKLFVLSKYFNHQYVNWCIILSPPRLFIRCSVSRFELPVGRQAGSPGIVIALYLSQSSHWQCSHWQFSHVNRWTCSHQWAPTPSEPHSTRLVPQLPLGSLIRRSAERT